MKTTTKRNFQLQLETLEDRLALSGVALGQDIIQANAIFSEADQRMHLIGVARNDLTGQPVANEVIQIGDYDNAPSVTDDALGAIYKDLSRGALLGQVTTDAQGHFDKVFIWSGTINLLFRLPADVWADLVVQATSTVPVQVAPPAPDQPQPAPGVDPAPATV